MSICESNRLRVAPTVKHLFNGFDVTLFAYGVTGTGKTHTMRGGKSLADRGVIPRLLSGIYRRCRKIEKDSKENTTVEVSMSYYEIYNDKVFDLFESPEKRTPTGLALRDNGGKTVVVGLTERPVGSLKEFEKLYDQANVNRSTSATKLNAHSSRSHAILCVKLTVTAGETVRVSTASAIDLAGSEDNRRTDNNKDRLVESAAINKSLFVLAQCVEAISKKASRIPYRESRMTRILSLGQNNGLTVMILNLAPVRSYHLDTLSSLNFANRTKKIEVREVENEPVMNGCSRPVPIFGGATMQRQPLRPLATTVHNATVHRRSTDNTSDKPPPGKPAKAFAVYADKPKRSSPLKRSSDGLSTNTRPIKAVRPTYASKIGQTTTTQITKASIEDMVEKKVSEILAARALEAPEKPQPAISNEMKERLDRLEKKIEAKDDTRAKGLNFMLMAKQDYIRGEYSSALKMFELSREYFPDNAKLEAKISTVRQKIQEKKVVEQQQLKPRDSGSNDEDYNPNAASDADDDEYADTSSISRPKPKVKKPRQKPLALAVFEDNIIHTPRTKQLLQIINSKDVTKIRLLKGVGAKKADAIVEALCANEDSGDVGTLGQLGMLKGVGVRTVENMRLGLAVGGEDDF